MARLIHETTEYLEAFLRNFLLNEKNPLHNRTLHISGTFVEDVKSDIGEEKSDIAEEKTDIQAIKSDISEFFNPKTTQNAFKLVKAYGAAEYFGRTDVMSATGLKTSRASDLIKDLLEQDIIEPVSGFGKGKYRFKKKQGQIWQLKN